MSRTKRCEGYIKKGSAFTMGPTSWMQCTNNAIVLLKVKQPGERSATLPACMDCWKKAQDTEHGIKIIEATPID